MALITIERARDNDINGYAVECTACGTRLWQPVEEAAQEHIDRFIFEHQHCTKGDNK